MLDIVVVEDRPEHMDWILNLLEDLRPILECRVVDSFQSWNKAVRYIEEHGDDFHIVVTDLQDRDSERFEGFRVIRAAKQRRRGVIAVSSFLDDPGHMKEVLRSGADFYVKKPFKPEWREWNEYPEELKRNAHLSMYFALRRFSEDRSLLGLPEQHVFISHAAVDKDLALELAESLRAGGFDTFLAARDLEGGLDFESEIRSAILAAELLIPLITPRSLGRPWVFCEIGAAWGIGKPILPALSMVDFDDLPPVVTKLHAERVETSQQRSALVNAARSLVDG